jgi:hypothetical protein
LDDKPALIKAISDGESAVAARQKQQQEAKATRERKYSAHTEKLSKVL